MGGGVYNAGTTSMVNSTFAGNSASLQGGGVANFGTLTAVSSTIAQNSVAPRNGRRHQNAVGTVSNLGGRGQPL